MTPNGTLLRQFAVALDDNPERAQMALNPDETLLYVTTENFVHVVSLIENSPFTSVQLIEKGRIRAAPVDGEVLGTLEAGNLLIVTGENEAGDWLQVRYNGAEGWIAKFLTGPLNR